MLCVVVVIVVVVVGVPTVCWLVSCFKNLVVNVDFDLQTICSYLFGFALLRSVSFSFALSRVSISAMILCVCASLCAHWLASFILAIGLTCLHH